MPVDADPFADPTTDKVEGYFQMDDLLGRTAILVVNSIVEKPSTLPNQVGKLVNVAIVDLIVLDGEIKETCPRLPHIERDFQIWSQPVVIDLHKFVEAGKPVIGKFGKIPSQYKGVMKWDLQVFELGDPIRTAASTVAAWKEYKDPIPPF